MHSEELPAHPTTLDMYKHFMGHTDGARLPAAILALAESIRGGAWHVGQGIGESIEDISPIHVDTKVNGHVGVEVIPSKRAIPVDTTAAKRATARKTKR